MTAFRSICEQLSPRRLEISSVVRGQRRCRRCPEKSKQYPLCRIVLENPPGLLPLSAIMYGLRPSRVYPAASPARPPPITRVSVSIIFNSPNPFCVFLISHYEFFYTSLRAVAQKITSSFHSYSNDDLRIFLNS